MTSRETVQLALISGGLWLIFAPIFSLPGLLALSTASINLREPNEAVTGFLRWTFLPVLVAVVLFGVLPGIYVIKSSEAWADRLVRIHQSAKSIEPSLVLAVCAIAVGLSTVVNGAIYAAGNLVALASASLLADNSSVIQPEYLQNSVRGFLWLVAGFLSSYWGIRRVLRAA